jgi:hypothetical protein
VSALSSLAFVLFALLFGVVSQHAGVFHAGWMVVGVALLAGALLVTVAMNRDFKRSTAVDTPSSSCGFRQN